VLTEVPPSAEILRTEIPGPVATILTFRTDQEAVGLANDTVFGLVSYVSADQAFRGASSPSRPRGTTTS